MDGPVFAFTVVGAEVASVPARLIHIGQVDAALALYLEHEDRATHEQDHIGAAMLHWQLVLKNRRVARCHWGAIKNFTDSQLEGGIDSSQAASCSGETIFRNSTSDCRM